MTRLQRLCEQWEADLDRLEDGHADALESDATDPLAIALQAGMIAAYQQIIRDAKR